MGYNTPVYSAKAPLQWTLGLLTKMLKIIIIIMKMYL